MKFSLAFILMVATALPVAAQTLSPAAFRDRYASMIREALGRPTVIVDDKTFTTKAADGTDFTVNIDNAYAQYIADPASLEAIIRRYVAVLVAGARPQDDPIDRLIVIVRPTDYIRSSVAPDASPDKFPPSRPMAGDLSFFLAVDGRDSIRTLATDDLERWKVDVPTAWKRAIVNIKARMGPLTMLRLGSEEGASGFGAESGLAPSLLADPGFCGPDAPEGKPSGQVVLVYAKDMFLFTVPDDAAMTATFGKNVDQELKAGRSMSNTPITCHGGRWTVAMRP